MEVYSMKNIKFEVIRDYDGNVDGYRLGNYYLMKHYHWDNTYNWIINKDGAMHYFECEFWKLVDLGEVEIVLNCKEGKKRLIELQEV